MHRPHAGSQDGYAEQYRIPSDEGTHRNTIDRESQGSE